MHGKGPWYCCNALQPRAEDPSDIASIGNAINQPARNVEHKRAPTVLLCLNQVHVICSRNQDVLLSNKTKLGLLVCCSAGGDWL